MKATAVAPSNIAFVKYWGKKDELLRLPLNGSISMNLSGLTTTTSVEFSEDFPADEILIGKLKAGEGYDRVSSHLDRIRKMAGISLRARVTAAQNFPAGTGLSSSASGFAALTVAGCRAAGLNLSEKELSILARQGSGSACRSVPDGFTEWLDGETSDASYAVSIFPPEHWALADTVAVVTRDKKDVPTTEGMKGLIKSPFYEVRLSGMNAKLKLCREAIKKRDLEILGTLIESEALEMHAVMMTQKPPLLYWTPGTLTIMKMVQNWRKAGLMCYFTINTGQNIHILSEAAAAGIIRKRLKELDFVREIITSQPAPGARVTDRT